MGTFLKENREASEHGFTMTEVLIAVVLTTIVMSSVFALLFKGQEAFRREPEVSEVNTNARSGMEAIARDLVLAGNGGAMTTAVLWVNGSGNNPDGITILYADPDVPTSRPVACGVCGSMDQSSTVTLDPSTLDPLQADPATAYDDGMILFALERSDCNGDGQVGIYPLQLTAAPTCPGGAACTALTITYSSVSGLSLPSGFNSNVQPDCALVGRFRAVQYRVNPPPPTASPSLERRDLALGEAWNPLSRNIENLQLQYAVGSAGNFVDAPPVPNPADPETWVTRVRVMTAGRSQSTNLQGASAGVFSSADTFVRQTFSTVVHLRNVSAASGSGGGSYN